MKREAINESEADLNEDALLPLVEDMLQMRIDGWERFNKMFGTNVKVKLSSSWYKIAKESSNTNENLNDSVKNDIFNSVPSPTTE